MSLLPVEQLRSGEHNDQGRYAQRRWRTWAQPSSYLVLAEGVPVYSSDGKELGKVEHVLAAPEDDIFDGFVIDTSVLPGGHRFVDAPEVEEIYERGRRAQDRRRGGRAACRSRARTRARSRSAPTTWSQRSATKSCAAPGT